MMKEKKELELARKDFFNPFGMMRRFSEDMERLFGDFEGVRFPTFFNREFWPLRTEFETFEWMPQIEVLHKDGQFMVRADLPGLKKEDVKVEMTEDLLTISGERKKEMEEKREGFYRTERNYGRFYRQISLPEGVKFENANATFHHGVLEITMPVPKMEKHIRKLEIKEAPVKTMKAAA